MLDFHDTHTFDLVEPNRSSEVFSNCDQPDCAKSQCGVSQCCLLKEAGKLKSFAKGDVIFWDGDKADTVYIIVSGVVRGTKLLSDGRRQVTRFAFKNELLEYSQHSSMPFTAEAITPVEVRAIPRRLLEASMNQTPCLKSLVMRAILDELHQAQCQVMALGRLSAQERVAQFLYNLRNRIGVASDGAFDLPMARQDIADHLGLTIETVSRVISRLKRDNKIKLLPFGRIAIPDPSAFSDELLADAA